MAALSAGWRQRDLTVRRAGSPGTMLAVTHYQPQGAQDRHEHDHAQISFLVAGSARESIGRKTHEISGGGVCIKPAGADHENLWGSNGALIVSARLQTWDSEIAPKFPIATWVPCSTAALASVIGVAVLSGQPDEIDSAVNDLTALLDAERSTTRDPPGWLRRVTEALMEGETLSADRAAALAGVHRVHLSRSFARHYGIPFGLFRNRVMAARAVRAMVRSNAPLADIAHQAGFADQSHMHRSIAGLSGLTPRQFRLAFQSLAIAC
jgi:AraC-like DNA-binding protein